jgi:hypothetical protein
MIANLAVLKSFGFILPLTKLFDRGRVAGTPLSRKRPEEKWLGQSSSRNPSTLGGACPKKESNFAQRRRALCFFRATLFSTSEIFSTRRLFAQRFILQM